MEFLSFMSEIRIQKTENSISLKTRLVHLSSIIENGFFMGYKIYPYK